MIDMPIRFSMKKSLKVHAFLVLFVFSLVMATGKIQAATVLLAGFDNSGTDAVVADLAANTTHAGITATFDGRGRATNWGSNDGFYGGTAIAASSSVSGTGSYRAAIDKNDTVGASFTITNSTGQDVSIEQISFDLFNNDESTRDYYDIVSLYYVSGDLSLTDSTLINQATGLSRHRTTDGIGSNTDYADFDWSLTGLADYTLADGESATFRIHSTWTDTAATDLRNFASIDNIGFIGQVIPEPSSVLLGGFGLLLLMRRRR